MIEYGVQLSHAKQYPGSPPKEYYFPDRELAEQEYGDLTRNLSPDNWSIALGYRTAAQPAGEFRELTAPDLLSPVLSDLPEPPVIADILSLTGEAGDVMVPAEVIALWTEAERVLAVEWAAAEHLSASDNEGVERRRKPGFVTRAQEICGDPVQAQLALEAWTMRPPESDFMLEPVAVTRMAREALTAMTVLMLGRSLDRQQAPAAHWRDKAMEVMRGFPSGLSVMQLREGLGPYAPHRELLVAWLQDGEKAGVLEHSSFRTWKIAEKASTQA